MPKRKEKFNRKIFSILIDKARGERSLRSFASDCDISYLQMRKLYLCEQQNAPGFKLIKKLAENSENEVDIEDYLFAAGEKQNEQNSFADISQKERLLLQNYNSLSTKQQKTVDDFIDFLIRYKK